MALPYFERYSDANNVLAVLSGDSRDCWLHSPFDHVRAIRAVALAYLAGGRESFEDLVDRKRGFLTVSSDRNAQRNLPLFDEIVAKLRSRWGESRGDLAYDRHPQG